MEKVANFCKMCGKELKDEERPLALCKPCRESAGGKPLEKIVSECIAASRGPFDNLAALASFFMGVAALLNYFVYHIVVGYFKIDLGMMIQESFMLFSWLLAGLVLGVIGLIQPGKSRLLSYIGIVLVLIVMALRSRFWVPA